MPYSLRNLFIVIVSLTIIPLSGAATEIYVPSLPAIHDYFATSQSLTQFTITVFIISSGLFQLAAGPLSDALGRKPLLIFGGLLFAIASIAAACTPSITFLILMRACQGFASAMITAPARAVLSDVFTGKQLKTVASYMTIAWALGPIISPFIGGYLQTYFGWQSNFYFLVCYGILCLVLVALMPETLKEKHTLHPKHIWKNYKTVLSNRLFQSIVLIISCVFSVMTVFYVVGPFLIQSQLHYSPIFYGKLGLFLGLAWFAGNTINRFTINIDSKKRLLTGLIGLLSVSTALLLLSLFTTMTAWNIIIPTVILFILAGFSFPIGFGICISLFPTIGGYASAALGASVFIGSGIMTVVASLLGTHNQTPLAMTYIVLSIICLLSFYRLRHELMN